MVICRITLVWLLVLAAPSVVAAAAEARSTYCSPSGDLCYGALKRGGRVYLQIDLAARYFSKYSLCVTPPRGRGECNSFRIRKRGALYGSTVRWSLHFPNRGRGTYRARWRLEGDPLGPSVSFRR